MTPTSIDIEGAKRLVTTYLYSMPEGTFVRARDLVRHFGFPPTWSTWVGCWISKHPRSEQWSRTHYRIGERM